VADARAAKKKTRPPKRFTDATLLTAMETAGKDSRRKRAFRRHEGIRVGTPATRASIIEVLLTRAYVVRNGKALEATAKGIHLIEVVHPEVKSPAMTGQWESYLQRIQRGGAQLEPFLEGSKTTFVRCGESGGCPARYAPPPAPAPMIDARGKPLDEILHSASVFESSGPIRKRFAGRPGIERRSAGDAHRFRQIALLSTAGVARGAQH